MKNFKSLYGFGGRCLKIRDACMDFEPYFKVHNLVSVHPKSIILGQMTNLNMIFHVGVSVYRLVKIWNSPLLVPVLWWISERPFLNCTDFLKNQLFSFPLEVRKPRIPLFFKTSFFMTRKRSSQWPSRLEASIKRKQALSVNINFSCQLTISPIILDSFRA